MFSFVNSNNDKYYKILGLNKDASIEDVKKAYKKLALRYHPDRNINNKEEACKKFKEISEAHKVLSNPQKRREYDTTGSVSSVSGGGEQNPFEMFNKIFKKHVSEFVNSKSSTKSDNNFADILNGLNGSIRFKINKDNNQTNQTNQTKQTKQPKQPKQPDLIKPKDYIVYRKFSMEDIYRGTTQPTTINLIRRFKDNDKIIYKKITKTFNIPLKGREIFIENSGNHIKGYKKPADLLIIIDDIQNNKYKRINNYDLLVYHTISYEELPKNGTLDLKLPDNRTIHLKIDIECILKNGCKLIEVNDKGLPFIINDEVNRGKLYVQLNIIFPNFKIVNDISNNINFTETNIIDIF